MFARTEIFHLNKRPYIFIILRNLCDLCPVIRVCPPLSSRSQHHSGIYRPQCPHHRPPPRPRPPIKAVPPTEWFLIFISKLSTHLKNLRLCSLRKITLRSNFLFFFVHNITLHPTSSHWNSHTQSVRFVLTMRMTPLSRAVFRSPDHSNGQMFSTPLCLVGGGECSCVTQPVGAQDVFPRLWIPILRTATVTFLP